MNILIILYFFILTLATYEDIKKREVYDFLNFFLIISVLIYSILLSFITEDYKIILYVSILMMISFIFSLLLYSTGMWGFGDVKFMISLGGLIYFYKGFLISYLLHIFSIIGLPQNQILLYTVLLLIFLTLSFIASGLISIIVILYLYFQNLSKIKYRNFEKLILALGIILTGIFDLFFTKNLNTSLIVIINLLIVFIWLSIITKKIENIAFTRKKSINKIVPGDWIVEDIKIDEKTIFPKEKFRLGISEDDLKKLQKLYLKHKINKVLVKDGMPFFLGFFISFILLFFNYIYLFI